MSIRIFKVKYVSNYSFKMKLRNLASNHTTLHSSQSPMLLHFMSLPWKVVQLDKKILRNPDFCFLFPTWCWTMFKSNTLGVSELESVQDWLKSSLRCTASSFNAARTTTEVVSSFSDREKTQTHPLKYFLKTVFDLLGASWTRPVNQRKPFSLIFSWMNCSFITLF